MSGTPTPIEAGTELDYLLRCVADGLGRLATRGYAVGDSDRDGRRARTIACEPFCGRFTADELAKVSGKSPGMRVAITGVQSIAQVGGGEVDMTLEFGAVIITQSRTFEWDGVAARTLQAVLTGMQWQNWDSYQGRAPFLHPGPTGINAANLAGDVAAKAGVTLWGITWRQQARLSAVTDIVDGPASLHVKSREPYGPPPLRNPADRFSGSDRAAAEAVRDMMLTDTAEFDANPALGIILSWVVDGQNCTIYQVRQEGAWVDFRTHVYTEVRTLSDWPA